MHLTENDSDDDDDDGDRDNDAISIAAPPPQAPPERRSLGGRRRRRRRRAAAAAAVANTAPALYAGAACPLAPRPVPVVARQVEEAVVNASSRARSAPVAEVDDIGKLVL